MSELHPDTDLADAVAADVRDLAESRIEHVRVDAAERSAVERVEHLCANLHARRANAEPLLNADVLVPGERIADVDDESGIPQRERCMVDDESRRDVTVSGNVALGNRGGVELR